MRSVTCKSTCGDFAGTDEASFVDVNRLKLFCRGIDKLTENKLLKIIIMQKLRRCYIYQNRGSDKDWMDRCQTAKACVLLKAFVQNSVKFEQIARNSNRRLTEESAAHGKENGN